jgi:plastocyanin
MKRTHVLSLTCLLLAGCASGTGGGGDMTGGANANVNTNVNVNDNASDNSGNVNDNTDGSITDVSIQNIAYSPSSITIPVGTTVRWTNNETANISHTVTSGNPGDADAGSLFDGNLSSGESFTFTFEQAGTFIYFCRIHPAVMRDAMVIVTED